MHLALYRQLVGLLATFTPVLSMKLKEIDPMGDHSFFEVELQGFGQIPLCSDLPTLVQLHQTMGHAIRVMTTNQRISQMDQGAGSLEDMVPLSPDIDGSLLRIEPDTGDTILTLQSRQWPPLCLRFTREHAMKLRNWYNEEWTRLFLH